MRLKLSEGAWLIDSVSPEDRRLCNVAAAIIGGAVIGAGGSYLSAQGSKKGGEEAAKGAQASVDEQRREFDLQRQDTAPYRQIGVNALSNLGGIYGYSSPRGGAPANGIDPS